MGSRKLSEAPYNKTVDWAKWYVFWADERVVAKSHADSNYKLAKDGFLSKVSFQMSCDTYLFLFIVRQFKLFRLDVYHQLVLIVCGDFILLRSMFMVEMVYLLFVFSWLVGRIA